MHFTPDFGRTLPKGWPTHVRSAVIHVCSLAHVSLVTTRGWMAHHRSSYVRQKSENQRLRDEVFLLTEELRIKSARMDRIPSQRRPHYPPLERMRILELRARRGWSLREAARHFQISVATLSAWMRRLDEAGPDAVVQIPTPVNKFPDLVRYIVQRLKVWAPTLGYKKIAWMLCRAGVQLGPATVGRMLREEPPPRKTRRTLRMPRRRVESSRPNEVWLSDLTIMPLSDGFWISFCNRVLRPLWPNGWWVAVVADHFSRRILGVEVFWRPPTAEEMRRLFQRILRETGARPERLVTDRGSQFRETGFREWCRSLGIRQRFGFLGEFGGIPRMERLIQTVKVECMRRQPVPFLRSGLRRELVLFRHWYNGIRPHEALGGATPDERYGAVSPGQEAGAAVVVARVGAKNLSVRYVAGRPHLPSVELGLAA